MSKAIHLYQPSSKKWVKAWELLTERSMCVCIVLPSREILVAGGFTDTTFVDSVTNEVEVATIQ